MLGGPRETGTGTGRVSTGYDGYDQAILNTSMTCSKNKQNMCENK